MVRSSFPSSVVRYSIFDCLNCKLYFHFQVVGDVAILNSLPEGDEETQRKVGEWIMSKNKAMKVCKYFIAVYVLLSSLLFMPLIV